MQRSSSSPCWWRTPTQRWPGALRRVGDASRRAARAHAPQAVGRATRPCSASTRDTPSPPLRPPRRHAAGWTAQSLVHVALEHGPAARCRGGHDLWRGLLLQSQGGEWEAHAEAAAAGALARGAAPARRQRVRSRREGAGRPAGRCRRSRWQPRRSPAPPTPHRPSVKRRARPHDAPAPLPQIPRPDADPRAYQMALARTRQALDVQRAVAHMKAGEPAR